MCSTDIFLGLLAILFPPIAVWVKCGVCSADSVINILLCVLGYLPGLLHAWYIIAKFPEPEYEYDAVPQRENGRVTYIVVNGDGRHHQQQAQRPPKPQDRMSYGATKNSNLPPPQEAGVVDAGEGSSGGAAPPSYSQVVAGDNKVQTRD